MLSGLVAIFVAGCSCGSCGNDSSGCEDDSSSPSQSGSSSCSFGSGESSGCNSSVGSFSGTGGYTSIVSPGGFGGIGGSAATGGSMDSSSSACALGFDDCTPAPGCETEIVRDPQHCGACGNACTACTHGSCFAVERLSDRDGDGATILTVDDTGVYFAVAGATSALRFVPLLGGAVLGIANGDFDPIDLESAAGRLFVLDARGATIQSVPREGGALEIEVALPDAPVALATDESFLYWLRAEPSLAIDAGLDSAAFTDAMPEAATDASTDAPQEASPDDGSTSSSDSSVDAPQTSDASGDAPDASGDALVDAPGDVLVEAPSDGSAEGSAAVVTTFIERRSIGGGMTESLHVTGGDPVDLSVRGGEIYVLLTSPPALLRLPSSGGAVTRLTEGLSEPTALAVDDTFAYVGDRALGGIVRIDLAGLEPDLVIATSAPSTLVTNAGAHLFAGEGDGRVFRTDDAGDTTLLAGGLAPPMAVAVDSLAFYWSSPGGQVFRLPR